MRRGISFRWALFARVLLLVIPVLLVGEAVMYFEIKNRMFDTAKRDLTDNAEVQAVAVQTWVHDLKRHAVLASRAEILKDGNLDEIKEYLNSLKKDVGEEIQCIHYINVESSVIETSTCPSRIGRLTSALPWFKGSIKGEPYLSDPFPGRLNFQPVIVFTAPIFSDTGRQTGILLYAANLYEKTGSMYKPTETGFTMLTDQQGTVLSHPNLELILEGNIFDFETKLRDIAGHVLQGGRGFDRYLGEKGDEMLVGYSSIEVSPEKRWGVFVAAPLREELAGLDIIRKVMAALIVILLSADLAVTLYISRSLARPLEALTETAARIRGGDLSLRAKEDSRVKEIDHLAAAFNEMVANLAERTKESEMLANITESSADAIMSTDAEGNITSWNRGAEQIFGYTKDEIIGRHFYAIVPEDLREEAEKLRKAVSEKGFIRSYETHRRHKSGKRVPVSLTITALKDAQGRVIGNAGIFKDLTEKVKAEEEIRRLKEFNENIIKSAPMGIFTTDRKGVITSVNPVHLEMMGAEKAEQVLGLNVLELPAVKALGWDKLFREALRGKPFELHKQRYTSVYGKTVYLTARCVPLKDKKGGIMGLLAIMEDVTEQTLLEEEVLRAKNKTIEHLRRYQEYVDEVAHSLRNPLQVFKGNLEIMNVDAMAQKERDIFEKVVESSREVEKKIKELTRSR
jgi:PAS domain S-box-containing protein